MTTLTLDPKKQVREPAKGSRVGSLDGDSCKGNWRQTLLQTTLLLNCGLFQCFLALGCTDAFLLCGGGRGGGSGQKLCRTTVYRRGWWRGKGIGLEDEGDMEAREAVAAASSASSSSPAPCSSWLTLDCSAAGVSHSLGRQLWRKGTQELK